MKAKLLVITVVAGLMASAAQAAAEDVDKEAKAAYQQGVADFGAGRFDAAATAFRKAFDLKPSWKIRYNIGQSEAAAKRYGLALDAFEAYLAEGGDDVESSRRDEVLGEIQRLRLLVGGLDIKGPAGATVEVDGTRRGTLPLGSRIRETAGVDHEVVVRATDGSELLRRTGIRVGSGEVVTVEVEGEEQTAPAAAASAQPAPDKGGSGKPHDEEGGSHGPLWTWGWVGVGVGAAVAVAGGVTGGLALSKQSDLESKCPDKACASQKDLDLRDSADTLALMTDVLIPVGAAIAVAGAVLLIVDHTSGSEATAMTVVPSVGGDGAGLVLEGRF
jgi:hypothetical protein